MNDATPVYLDHNATTPPAPEVLREMVDAYERTWANPSSTHVAGQAARRVLADARARVASFLGCRANELVFTSGATEANHAAILGALKARAPQGRTRLVVSSIEHPGLLALAARLEGEGVPVTRLPVDAQGRLDAAVLRATLAPDAASDVALVSVMGANNETGVRLDLDAVAALAHAAGAWLHVDATQLAGKAPFSFADTGIDLASVSAHKLHGPRGVGALVIRHGLALPPLFSGRQERHRRGGTENVAAAAGFAAACDAIAPTLAADLERLRALRDRLELAIVEAVPRVHVHGRDAPRLANTSCLRFDALDADLVLGRLERAGVLASSGAACSAGGTQPSHVLLAMGESPLRAKAGIRFSLGRTTTSCDIDLAIAAVRQVIAPLLDAPSPPDPSDPSVPHRTTALEPAE